MATYVGYWKLLGMFVKLCVTNKGVATYVGYWKLLVCLLNCLLTIKGWLRM